MREGPGFSLSERPAMGAGLAGPHLSALVSLPNAQDVASAKDGAVPALTHPLPDRVRQMTLGFAITMAIPLVGPMLMAAAH